MSERPTIEERIKSVPSFERTEHGKNALWAERTIFCDAILRDDAAKFAREYAAERTEPLVAVILNLVATWETGHKTGRSMRGPIEDALAALAAEKEARQ